MTLHYTRWLPILLIIIDVGAALAYLTDGDYRRTLYWISAAVLTATVTF